MEWFFIAIIIVVALMGYYSVADEEHQRELTNQRAKEAEIRNAKIAELEKQKRDFIELTTKQGWKYLSEAKVMNQGGQPQCFIMTSDNGAILRMVEYGSDEHFSPKDSKFININQIISLNVASPTITDARKKTIHHPVSETQTKSPVARGLVGGAIMGPAGLILGAASGLGSKTTTRFESQTVYEPFTKKGDPQLIIGTTSPDAPILKIKFDPPSLADEWMYRIRALQSSLRR